MPKIFEKSIFFLCPRGWYSSCQGDIITMTLSSVMTTTQWNLRHNIQNLIYISPLAITVLA